MHWGGKNVTLLIENGGSRTFSMLFRTSSLVHKNFLQAFNIGTNIYWGRGRKCGTAHRAVHMGVRAFKMLFKIPNLTYFGKQISVDLQKLQISKNIWGGKNVALLIEGWGWDLDFIVCYSGHQTWSVVTRKKFLGLQEHGIWIQKYIGGGERQN